jgi:hypothetical protein
MPTSINTDMHQYKVRVKVSGVILDTLVYAINSSMAIKVAQAQYGATAVASTPTRFEL